MKYIHIILFIIFSEALYAQKYVLGKDKILNYWTQDYLSCRLHILDTQYCIVFSVLTGDIVRNMFVSYGYIRKNGNLYHLKDIPTNAEIVLEKDKYSNFDIKKGFSFMQNEYFVYEGKADSLVFYRVGIGTEYAKKEKELHLIENKQLFHYATLRMGKYRNGNVCVLLEKDTSYKILYIFEMYSCLVSEGKWIRDGDILKLHDPFLDYSFTALIGNEGELTVIDFPNELNERVMYSLVTDTNGYRN